MTEELAPALWPSLCRQFAASFPPERHSGIGVVVAVSGGADSVALLRLIADVWQADPQAQRRQLVVAHFNHALRGEHSSADQRFVAELAQSLQIDFVTETATSAGGPPIVDEESLRKRRYDFLHRTMAARGARCVLTAHTADDQIETILHHLFRGTGPAGLCGMPAWRSIADDFLLLRPLLALRRTQLRQGLIEIGQRWREDRSNAELDYQRNWIRGELLPQIRTRYPAADQAILRLIDHQSQWHQTLRAAAEAWIDERVLFADDRVTIGRGPLDRAVFALAISLIWDRLGWPRQSLTAKHYRRIAALVAGDHSAPITLPGAIAAQVAADHLLLQRSAAKPLPSSPDRTRHESR